MVDSRPMAFSLKPYSLHIYAKLRLRRLQIMMIPAKVRSVVHKLNIQFTGKLLNALPGGYTPHVLGGSLHREISKPKLKYLEGHAVLDQISRII